MSDYNNNKSNTRERTNTVKEVDREAAKSSKYTPKVTIEKPNRNVPADFKKKRQNMNKNDHSVKIPVHYSTIMAAITCIILTASFCYYCIIHEHVSSMAKGVFLILSAIFWCFFMKVFVPPFPQDQSYHNFADRRSLRAIIPSISFMKISNVFDVLSNLPFLFVGLYGLCLFLSPKNIVFLTSFEKLGWIILFISSVFVFIGSSYYHLKPSNATLVWDRLPMTVGFSSILGLLIDERINPSLGKFLYPFLLAAGFASCAYWYYRDDLRPYILIQFFPMIYIPILILISPSVYSQTIYYVFACGLYTLAKLCEIADKQIFRLTSKTISGHTLKHIFSALAIAVMVYMLQTRVVL
ncbi:unnamed protein product [Adineta steineri]|uniref:Uncharacterized protein n=1 Tax=Adineta steineri TaxID=433720 RepID=A0A813M5X4_9BILA|nr:unnamed protein product [Adineta steineri]CAF3711829.1 unnamed protein product [Adineta steineri]